MNNLEVRNHLHASLRDDRGQISGDFKKAKLQKGKSKFLKNDSLVAGGIFLGVNVIYFAVSAMHSLGILQNILKEKMVML